MATSSIDLGVRGLHDIEVIGSGGSAIVYKAVREVPSKFAMQEIVAVKVLRSSWDAAARRRFEREQRVMARLSETAGFVPILETGETDDGSLYIVMPYYDGGSLQQRIARNGPLDWPRSVRLVEQVAQTLVEAHELDVYHRDVKPANILLSEPGRPHVADFGISLIADDTASRAASTAAFTPAYSPPESFTEGLLPVATTDIYGLAATLWAVLAGHAPFKDPGERPAPVTVFGRVAMYQVGDLRDRVPSPICRFIERSMAKQPESRPLTMVGFLAELQAAREDAYRGVEAERLEVDPLVILPSDEVDAGGDTAESTGPAADFSVGDGVATVASFDTDSSARNGPYRAPLIDLTSDGSGVALDAPHPDSEADEAVGFEHEVVEPDEGFDIEADGDPDADLGLDDGPVTDLVGAREDPEAATVDAGTGREKDDYDSRGKDRDGHDDGDAADGNDAHDELAPNVLLGSLGADEFSWHGQTETAVDGPGVGALVSGQVPSTPSALDDGLDLTEPASDESEDFGSDPVAYAEDDDWPAESGWIGKVLLAAAATVLVLLAFWWLLGPRSATESEQGQSEVVIAGGSGNGSSHVSDGESALSQGAGNGLGVGSGGALDPNGVDLAVEEKTEAAAGSGSDNADGADEGLTVSGSTSVVGRQAATPTSSTPTSGQRTASEPTDGGANVAGAGGLGNGGLPSPASNETSTSTTSRPTTTTTSSTTTTATTSTTTTAPPSNSAAIAIVQSPYVVSISATSLVFAYRTNDVCGTGSFDYIDVATGVSAGHWTGDRGCFGPLHYGRSRWPGATLEPNTTYLVKITIEGQPSNGTRPTGTGQVSTSFQVTTPAS